MLLCTREGWDLCVLKVLRLLDVMRPNSYIRLKRISHRHMVAYCHNNMRGKNDFRSSLQYLAEDYGININQG